MSEREAIHKFHQQVIEAACLAVIVNSDNVRMIQDSQGARLLLEPRGELWVVGPFRREQLERDETVQRFLPRFVNDPHPAAA